MTRRLPALLLAAAVVAAAALSAEARAPTSLKSVSVKLPESTRALPEGPGVKVATNNCLGCHSAGMILNQPALAQAAWQAEVDKMRNVYKAPVAPADVPAIVAYLTAVKGAR
jgi:cytochrome c5